MARNGSGTYTLPAGNPVVTGTTVSSTVQNTTMTDIANAITQSLSKDGQTLPTANLPMGGYKLTGLGAATVAGDAVRYEQMGSPPPIGNVSPNTGAFTALTATSVNAGQLAGTRNAAINGGMFIANGAAASLTSTMQFGPVDRIRLAAVGGTGISGSIIQGTSTAFASGYYAGMGSCSWTSGQIFYSQRMRAANVARFNGQTITASCKIYQDTGGSRNFSFALNKANALNNFTTVTQIGANFGTTAVPSGATTNIAGQITLAATDAANGLELLIFDNAANTVVSKNYFMGDLQLELGAAQTSFEHVPELEAIRCAPYAQRVQWSVRDFSQISGTLLIASQTFPVPMYATPTVTNISAGTIATMGSINITPSTYGFRVDALKTAAGDSYILDRVDLMRAEL